MSPSKRKCFQYIKNHTSWDESQKHCQGYHGQLAAIASLQELKFVEKLCGEVVNGCWIGGTRNKSTIVVDWRWSDNSTWNVSIIPQTHLRSNCNNLSCQSDENLSLCTLTSGTNGSNLVTEKCNSSHAYICMTHKGNPLPLLMLRILWLLSFLFGLYYHYTWLHDIKTQVFVYI